MQEFRVGKPIVEQEERGNVWPLAIEPCFPNYRRYLAISYSLCYVERIGDDEPVALAEE
jgi:hypothetical protein